MNTPKFKIGDKVRFIGTSYYDFGLDLGAAKKGDVPLTWKERLSK